jgi:hypothetical protein
MMELSLWGLSLDNMAKLTTNAEKFFGEQQNAIRRLYWRCLRVFGHDNICQDKPESDA